MYSLRSTDIIILDKIEFYFSSSDLKSWTEYLLSISHFSEALPNFLWNILSFKGGSWAFSDSKILFDNIPSRTIFTGLLSSHRSQTHPSITLSYLFHGSFFKSSALVSKISVTSKTLKNFKTLNFKTLNFKKWKI